MSKRNCSDMTSDSDVSSHHGDDNNDGGGKLLVMRYKQSEIIHNAAIATANALQEQESEADRFMADFPNAFFINCVFTMGLDRQLGRSKESVNVVFPVILKRDHYYIIIGEERTPVYRVLNPKELFFTSGGRRVLIYLLSKNYRGEGEHLDFYENREGTREAYCVPKFLGTPRFINGAEFHPTNKWDKCDNSIIALQAMIPEVHDQVVPPNCKSSLQIVDLNDPVNIVDIQYPGAQQE
eukprot:scaffold33663_cov232-Skeletonema_dohrnii-CCMP3373.AAC.1